MLEADGARVSWTYDAIDQLLSEHRSGAHAYHTTFTYDAVGNLMTKNEDGAVTTYAYDVANQLETSQAAGGTMTTRSTPSITAADGGAERPNHDQHLGPASFVVSTSENMPHEFSITCRAAYRKVPMAIQA